MTVPFLRTEYNYDMKEASDAGALICTAEEGKTQQQFCEECDINTIIRRFGLAGEMPPDLPPASHVDYDDVFDFQSAMNATIEARENFMRMPAAIRARFENDPQLFLEFCTESKDGKLVNLEEMRKIGLAVPAEAGAASELVSSNVVKDAGK